MTYIRPFSLIILFLYVLFFPCPLQAHETSIEDYVAIKEKPRKVRKQAEKIWKQARALVEKGDTLAAAKEFEKAGLLLLQANDTAQADLCFAEGVEVKSVFSRAWCQYREGKLSAAKILFRTVADTNYDIPDAAYLYAMLMVDYDIPTALRYFVRTVNLKPHLELQSKAALEAGRIYYSMKNAKADTLAFTYMNIAAKGKEMVPYSCYCLGVFYEYGVGCAKDYEKAMVFYKEAKSMKVPQAKEAIERLKKKLATEQAQQALQSQGQQPLKINNAMDNAINNAVHNENRNDLVK